MSLKKKIIFLSVSFLILFSFLISFLIFPLFKDIKKISEQLLSTKADLIILEDKILNLQDFREKYPKIKDNLLMFESSLVDKEIPIDFINFLEKTGQDSQVSIEISSPKPLEDFLSLQIKVVGLPKNLFRFLEKIEKSQYLAKIEKINISKLTEIELKSKEFEKFSSEDVKASFSLKVYTK